MKTFLSIVSVAILTVAAGTASAAPVQLTTAQLDNVTAGALAVGVGGGIAAGSGRTGSFTRTNARVSGNNASASASNYGYTRNGFVVSGALSIAAN